MEWSGSWEKMFAFRSGRKITGKTTPLRHYYCHEHTFPNLSTIFPSLVLGSPRRNPGDGGTTDGRSLDLLVMLLVDEQLEGDEGSFGRGGGEFLERWPRRTRIDHFTVRRGLCGYTKAIKPRSDTRRGALTTESMLYFCLSPGPIAQRLASTLPRPLRHRL